MKREWEREMKKMKKHKHDEPELPKPEPSKVVEIDVVHKTIRVMIDGEQSTEVPLTGATLRALFPDYL